MLIICQIDWCEVGVAFGLQCLRNCTLSSYHYYVMRQLIIIIIIIVIIIIMHHIQNMNTARILKGEFRKHQEHNIKEQRRKYRNQHEVLNVRNRQSDTWEETPRKKDKD